MEIEAKSLVIKAIKEDLLGQAVFVEYSKDFKVSLIGVWSEIFSSIVH